jgi:glycerol-3-phosphate dehydrogenase
MGMKLYDWISGRTLLFSSRYLSSEESLRHMPMLPPDKLVGTVAYADGQFDDSRYNMALLQTCTEAGGEILNYARVVEFGKNANGKLINVQVLNQHTGQKFVVRARAFVNATGPFSDGIRELARPGVARRLRLSKGSHILLPVDAIASNAALLVPKTDDGRVIFAIPWLGRLLVGTTDDEANLHDEMVVKREEAEYLLRHLNRYLIRPLTTDQIVSGFAGVRPLVSSGDTRNTKKLIRDHEVEVDQSSGLISVLGGKWTTYRVMAEDAVNTVQRNLAVPVSPCRTSHYLLSGSDGWKPNYWATLVRDYGVSNGAARHLSEKFGTTATKGLHLADGDSRLKQPVVEGTPSIQAEVIYSVREEMAMSIEDILARRIGLQLFSWEQAIAAAPVVGSLLAREFGWSSTERQQRVEEYSGKIVRLMQLAGLRPKQVLANAVDQ